jgi:hypothetical protein
VLLAVAVLAEGHVLAAGADRRRRSRWRIVLWLAGSALILVPAPPAVHRLPTHPEPFGDIGHRHPDLNLDADRPNLLARLSG